MFPRISRFSAKDNSLIAVLFGGIVVAGFLALLFLSGARRVEAATGESAKTLAGAAASVKMEAARAAAERGDAEMAMSLAEEASKLAPESPEPRFFLARRLILSEPFSGFNWLLSALGASVRNVSWLVSGLGTVSVLVLLSAVPALLAGWVVLFMVSVPLVNHEYAEGKLRWWLLALAAATVVLGLIPPLVFFSVLLWKYLSRKEKAFLMSIPVLLLLAYPVVSAVAANFALPASARAKALVGLREGRPPAYVREILSSAKTPEETFSLALASSRSGDCSRALALYGTIPPTWDLYYKVLNNSGVCYYRLGQTRVAVGQFEKARGKGRSVVEYNLSQMYRDELRFDEGDAVFRTLQAADPDAVFRFMASGQVVLEEVLPETRLLSLVMGSADEVQHIQSAVWKPFMGPIPLPWAPVASLLVFFLFGVVEKRTANKGAAYRCRKCGAIRCAVCDKRASRVNICQDCFAGSFQIGGVDPQERIARILRIQKNYDLRVRRARILAAIPGVGHYYSGRWWAGFLLSVLFMVGILLVSGVSRFFWVLYESGADNGIRMAGVALVVLSMVSSWIGIRKGAFR